MFRFKPVASKVEKTLGLMLRVFGIDFSFLCIWDIKEIPLIDLRIPCSYGVYLQIVCFVIHIGRMNDSIYQSESI